MKSRVKVSDPGNENLRSLLLKELISYNEELTGVSDFDPLAIEIVDEHDRVVGGLWGRTSFSWLYIEMLFVPASMRRRGLGSAVMSQAESEAVARGCRNAWLDTFQAREFYERLGYRCFGQLEKYPAERSRYFLTKSLA